MSKQQVMTLCVNGNSEESHELLPTNEGPCLLLSNVAYERNWKGAVKIMNVSFIASYRYYSFMFFTRSSCAKAL